MVAAVGAASAEAGCAAGLAAPTGTTRWGVAAFLRCALLRPAGEAAALAGELTAMPWLRACCILKGLAAPAKPPCCGLMGDFWGFRLLGDLVGSPKTTPCGGSASCVAASA